MVRRIHSNLLNNKKPLLIQGFLFCRKHINNYSYSFNTLTFKFDVYGNLIGTLNYNYNNLVLESKFSFSNIGTTNLLNEQSVQDPVSYYLMNGGIDE